MSIAAKSPAKRVIAITGVTGAQGGSVLDHLYRDGSFQLRGITRSTTAPKAVELTKKYPDLQLFAADFNDEKGLVTALTGADGFFLVTQFWDSKDPKKETEQGINAINAAVKAGVKQIVFSSLPSGHLVAGIDVPHFDSKWRISQHLIQTAKQHKIAYTNLFVPYYWENLVGGWGPKPDKDGKIPFVFGMGGRALAQYSVTDTGGPVLVIFKSPIDSFDGRLVDFFGDVITVSEMVQTFERVTGRVGSNVDMPAEKYKTLPFASEEMTNMWALDAAIDDLRKLSKTNPIDPYTAKLGLPASAYVIGKALYPKTLTFEEWLKASKWMAK